MPCSGSAPPRTSWGCGTNTPRPAWKPPAPRRSPSATRPTPAIKGILIAGTETTEAGDQTRHGDQVPAFLHGPKTLFEPRDDGGLAPVLELPTTGALPTQQLIGEAR